MTARPLLLDLFCGAGGAATGYSRAGFDVLGVDIAPQPHYPFPFIQADALEYLSGPGAMDVTPAAIHASPPCQHFTKSTRCRPGLHNSHADLVDLTRTALTRTGCVWVIENVPGAPIRPDFRLCGCLFGLPQLRRERWFETSWEAFHFRAPCSHTGRAVTVAGHTGNQPSKLGLLTDWRRAMGIDWMTATEMAQAVPPAYTELIGAEILELEGIPA